VALGKKRRLHASSRRCGGRRRVARSCALPCARALAIRGTSMPWAVARRLRRSKPMEHATNWPMAAPAMTALCTLLLCGSAYGRDQACAKVCAAYGACTVQDGLCVAATESDCKLAAACRMYGRCQWDREQGNAFPGCRSTARSCFTSDGFRWWWAAWGVSSWRPSSRLATTTTPFRDRWADQRVRRCRWDHHAQLRLQSKKRPASCCPADRCGSAVLGGSF